MRNLYPIEAFSEATDEVTKAAEASIRNRAPDGLGWTDLHVIASPKIDYQNVGLRLSEIAPALASTMPRVRRFIATATAGFDSKTRDPWGSYDDDAYCFGF